jgi:SARP family transcriptional regulator, regulator of embCAB operon
MAQRPWRILGGTWGGAGLDRLAQRTRADQQELRDHGGIMTPSPTRIQVCGRLAVELDGVRREQALPGPQGALLFAFLVVHRDQATTRDAAMSLLWPDDDANPGGNHGDNHRATFNALVSRLRHVLPCRAAGGTLRLDVPPDAWVDLEAARDAIHRAESAVAQRQWERAWSAAQTALFVARRGFVLGGGSTWAASVRHDLELLHQRALESYAVAALGLGGAELATAENASRELVRIAPLRESGHRLLMESLAARGNPAQALQVYDDLRVALRDELGASPAAETRDLHARLLR